MANPSFPSDGQGERVDALVATDGSTYFKRGIDPRADTGTTLAAATVVGTHLDAATAGSTDAVVVMAGESGTTVKHVLVDSGGRLITVGAGAIAAAIVGDPVRIGGSDGTNTRNLLVDTSGRALVSGAGASGAAVAGNPVRMGGSDGTNTRDLLTDTGGRLVAQMAALVSLGAVTNVRQPDTYKTAQASASGDTAVWTPASGKKVRLLRFMLVVSANATTSGGALVTFTLRDATTSIGIAFDVYLPSAAPGTTQANDGFDTGLINLGGAGFLSAAANNVLNLNLSAALTNGQARLIAMGVEE